MDEKVLKDTNDNLEQETIIALRKLYLKYGNMPIHWSKYFKSSDLAKKHSIALKYVTLMPNEKNPHKIEYVRIKPEVMDD